MRLELGPITHNEIFYSQDNEGSKLDFFSGIFFSISREESSQKYSGLKIRGVKNARKDDELLHSLAILPDEVATDCKARLKSFYGYLHRFLIFF